MEDKRLRNTKGQFKKASKVSEFGFVNLLLQIIKILTLYK